MLDDEQVAAFIANGFVRLPGAASASVPWYWEVTLAQATSTIATVRAYGLETEPGKLPDGVRPLRPANYLLTGEWTPADEDGIRIDFPFPITIPWTELEY
ncbi:hypothetical protein [Nocardia flavorosea]|uniref:hypothetical protein n=1 Tax=Nocardia flavorosea TaxID=53429 RepID=UPI000A6ECC83|nr:hypothetical protein [Nocardia flavorosea]